MRLAFVSTILMVFLLATPLAFASPFASSLDFKNYWPLDNSTGLNDILGGKDFTNFGSNPSSNCALRECRQDDRMNVAYDTSSDSAFTWGGMIFISSVGSGSSNLFDWQISGGDALRLRVHDTGNFIWQVGGSSRTQAYTTGKWYCVVASTSGSEISLYVNNTETSTAGAIPVTTDRTTFTVARAIPTGWKVDEIFYDDTKWSDADANQYCLDIGNGTSPLGTGFQISTLDIVKDRAIDGFCADFDNGTTTKTFCNNTGSVVKNNLTGVFNISYYSFGRGNSNLSGIYFNQTVMNADSTSDLQVLNAETFQSRLKLTLHKILNFENVTSWSVQNNRTRNTTTTGFLYIPATNSTTSNELYVNATGNFSFNVSRAGLPLSTIYSNITGLTDAKVTIGAREGNVGILNFTVRVVNTTLSLDQTNTTTNGSVVFDLLQNYKYFFLLNASDFAVVNTTRLINQSSTLINFTLSTANKFNITIRNETTNQPITNANISLQVISDSYANNYTTNNGTINIEALVPGDYEIIYNREDIVKRSFFTRLTPQSFQTLILYLIDSDISNVFVVKISDQDAKPVSGATVSLLRYYIDINGYRTVEMSKTDTNGKAVFRVEPNTINYKFLIVKGGASLETAPSKITTGQENYIINLQESPLTSLLNFPSVQTSLIFLNATRTFKFTWTDNVSLVTRGCMEVREILNGANNVSSYTCSDGSTGSLIYTPANMSQRRWIAKGIIETNTEFSTIVANTLEQDMIKVFENFGLIGWVLTLFVFLVFVFVGIGSTETVVISGLFAIFLMMAFGFIFTNWGALLGIVIIAGIIAYKTRS